MTIRVTNASTEASAEQAVKNQYQGFDIVFLQKKQKDQSEDYIYYFDLVDTTVECREEKESE